MGDERYQNKVFSISHVKKLIIFFVEDTVCGNMKKYCRFPNEAQNQYPRQ